MSEFPTNFVSWTVFEYPGASEREAYPTYAGNRPAQLTPGFGLQKRSPAILLCSILPERCGLLQIELGIHNLLADCMYCLD